MKGHREKLKHGSEYDVVSKMARSVYCYLINTSAPHKIKKQMSRRNRHSDKIDLKQESRCV